MRSKLFTLGLALLLCIPWLQPQRILATGAPSYAMITSSKADIDKEIQVTVRGTNLTDVFAYEFNIVFDSERLRFKEAKSSGSGFTVSPIVKGDNLTFAHSKIGQVLGDNGNLTFFTLSFQTIGQGEAEIEIKDVDLVNSKLVKASQNVGERVSITIGKPLLNDIAGHWAEASIQRAVELGIVSGYSDSSFRPQRHVTRNEFVSILMRALQLPAEDASELSFVDLDEIPTWARPSVSAAVKAKIINGFEDNTFRGDQPITRSESATMLVRAFGLETESELNPTFADLGMIPAYAQKSVAAAAKAGLIYGKENNLFAPNDNATRAEAVVLILRFLDKNLSGSVKP
ncbi:S-layer homology domain-containing protein [Paenibacillus sp. 2RAB27]|uniref:S-layer homology domain-containing protein n=1 Tax=Paenibacillus sp. 2RAB27 TaxID=3232991 RepID=UPI003F9D0BCB